METENNEKIIWNNNLSIGNVKIDEDHKRMVNICNELIDYVQSPNNKRDEFARLLSSMTDYSLKSNVIY